MPPFTAAPSSLRPWMLGQRAADARDFLEDLCAFRQADHTHRRAFLQALDRLKTTYLCATTQALSADYLLYIIKSCNLVHTEWEYKQKFAYLTCKPTNYLLDCTNNCQLGCGSCQHTTDRAYASLHFLPVRPGTMTRATHALILQHVAPWAYAADYYNKSESLLNRLAPEFVKAANQRRVITRISSNFAMPKLDVEALVASGLIISICRSTAPPRGSMPSIAGVGTSHKCSRMCAA